jgi:DNA-binding GntR family transcriptional regulator
MPDHDSSFALAPYADEPLSLSDRTYLILRERIVTLQLKPGQPIQEQQMMADLGVGRTPLREALRRLVLDRLVTVTPARGTFVRDISVADLPRLSEIRLELEGFVAHLAALRASANDRRAIEDLRAEFSQVDPETEQQTLLALYYRGHQLVYHCAQNVLLAEMLDRYLHLAMRIWYEVLTRLPDGLVDIVLAYDNVLAAIADHDAERAAEAATNHVSESDALIRSVL